VRTSGRIAFDQLDERRDRSQGCPAPLTPPVGSLRNDFYSFPSDCNATGRMIPTKLCRLGDTGSPKSIVVFGDSHARAGSRRTRPGSTARSERMHAAPESASSTPGAGSASARARGDTVTCAPTVVNRTITFFDRGHLSKTYVLELGQAFRTAFRQELFR
jgi:hypothetical protein